MSRAKRQRTMRNPLHDHPLMKRGGLHEKSSKAQRQQDKQSLKRQWRYSKMDRGLFLYNATQRVQRVSEGNWFTSRV